MNEKEIQHAIDRFNKRLEQFGISEQSLGWGTKGRARLRYEILMSQWDLNNSSVMDLGCGFGDMFEYMSDKGINTKYTGIDINPNFITIAKEKHGDKATFQEKNLLTEETTEQFDFVLSSGVFNHVLEDNMGFIKACFDKFDKISTKGFAANFLSDKVGFQYEYTFHASPAAILDLAYQYSNNVVLRNDYMPYEFTVFINKFAEVDEQTTVYKDFVKYV